MKGISMRYFDLHCDTITRCFDEKNSLLDGVQEISIEKKGIISDWGQCFAIFLDDTSYGAGAFQKYEAYIQYFIFVLRKYKEFIGQCRTAQDIEKTLKSGRCAAILTVENAAILGGELCNIDRFAADGVKIVAVTWNGENELGYGSGVGGRLKPFGRAAVAEMSRQGIAIDVSHISDEGFYDVLELIDGPVIATHSNLRLAPDCGHVRNLTERQFTAIVRRGGIVGINPHVPFLCDDEAKANKPEAMFRHVDRMLELDGENTITFGSDFDGAKMPKFCRNLTDIPHLFELFCIRYGDNIARKIFFENANVFFTHNFTSSN